MDSSGHIVIAALLAIGAIGFFGVLWVVPAYYKFIPRRLALATRTLSCVIGCGYVVAAYFVLQGARSLIAISFALIFCSVLNLIVLGVERPWSRRGQPSTTPRD
jgi:hypothetical protein